MAAIATFALKPGVWFRRVRLVIVSPDSQRTACLLSGRNSTYRPVQISGTSSVVKALKWRNEIDLIGIGAGLRLPLSTAQTAHLNASCLIYLYRRFYCSFYCSCFVLIGQGLCCRRAGPASYRGGAIAKRPEGPLKWLHNHRRNACGDRSRRLRQARIAA